MSNAGGLAAGVIIDEAAIRNVFTKLLGLKKANVEDEPSVFGAPELVADEEFADALHDMRRPAETTFVSFGRSFVHRAQGVGTKLLSELPLRR